jgi:hypothetical protein
MIRLRKSWHYATVAFIFGIVLTACVHFTPVGRDVFFSPALPLLKLFGYVPPVLPPPEPDELTGSIAEGFLAYLSATFFWIVLIPAFVWLAAQVYLTWRVHAADRQ